MDQGGLAGCYTGITKAALNTRVELSPQSALYFRSVCSFTDIITTPMLTPASISDLYVRLWILGGHLDAGIQGKHFTNVKTLRHVLDVLEWGRTTWKDVPSVDRGVIFNDTFVRGVRSMLLQAMLSVCLRAYWNHMFDVDLHYSRIFQDHTPMLH